MGGARIFAVWGQHGGRAKGIDAKQGMSSGHLAVTWGHVGGSWGRGQGRGHTSAAHALQI